MLIDPIGTVQQRASYILTYGLHLIKALRVVISINDLNTRCGSMQLALAECPSSHCFDILPSSCRRALGAGMSQASLAHTCSWPLALSCAGQMSFRILTFCS
jgi:hypothetical protein